MKYAGLPLATQYACRSIVDRVSSVDIVRTSAVPVEVTGGPSFIALAAGLDYTCGLTAGGQAWCW